MKKKKEFEKMWEDFSEIKARSYSRDKFRPTNGYNYNNYRRQKDILSYLHSIPLNSKMHLLDVGCASGKLVFDIAAEVERAVGVDIAQNFIKEANSVKRRKKIKNVCFKKAIIEKLPFKSNSFDVIVCSEVLEHIKDVKKAILEIRRVLKIGGYALITTPNWNGHATVWRSVYHLFRPYKFMPLREYTMKGIARHGDAHIHIFRRRDIVSELRKAKLKHIRSGTAVFLDFPLFNKVSFVALKIPGMLKLYDLATWIFSRLFPEKGKNIICLVQKTI